MEAVRARLCGYLTQRFNTHFTSWKILRVATIIFVTTHKKDTLHITYRRIWAICAKKFLCCFLLLLKYQIDMHMIKKWNNREQRILHKPDKNSIFVHFIICIITVIYQIMQDEKDKKNNTHEVRYKIKLVVELNFEKSNWILIIVLYERKVVQRIPMIRRFYCVPLERDRNKGGKIVNTNN